MSTELSTVQVGQRRFQLGPVGQLPDSMRQANARLFFQAAHLPNARDKGMLLKSYNDVLLRLQQMREAMNQLLSAVAQYANFPDYSALEQTSAFVPDMRLVEQDMKQLREGLQRYATASFDHFLRSVAVALDSSAMGLRMGLACWSKVDPRVCTYYYPHRVVERTHQDRDGQRYFSETTSFEANIHFLVKANFTPLTRRPAMPANARALAERIPDFLKPHAGVIDGDRYREETVRLDIGTRTWSEPLPRPVYQYDPALVIGPYVLIVW